MQARGCVEGHVQAACGPRARAQRRTLTSPQEQHRTRTAPCRDAARQVTHTHPHTASAVLATLWRGTRRRAHSCAWQCISCENVGEEGEARHVHSGGGATNQPTTRMLAVHKDTREEERNHQPPSRTPQQPAPRRMAASLLASLQYTVQHAQTLLNAGVRGMRNACLGVMRACGVPKRAMPRTRRGFFRPRSKGK